MMNFTNIEHLIPSWRAVAAAPPVPRWCRSATMASVAADNDGVA